MLIRFFNFIGILVLATSFIIAQLLFQNCEGSSNNKYLEIDNAGTESVDFQATHIQAYQMLHL